MTASAVQISNSMVKLVGDPPFWSTSCYGNTIIGGGQDRTILWRNGLIQYASLYDPVYGDNLGYLLASKAELTVTAADVGAPDALMTGRIEVREAWHRENTNERGWVGDPVEIDLGSTPSKIVVGSNSWGYFDRNITHRVFYVNFVDELGVYYEAAMIPYTSELADNTDSVTINVSSQEIVFNRPLEDLQQTRVFPAVRTGVFWKGRVWGAVLEPRDFKPGTKLQFTKDSKYVDILPTTPGGSDYPDIWRQADVYKGIVDRDTNKIIAMVDRIVTTTRVRIVLPNETEQNGWNKPDFTLTNPGISGNVSNIYATPIYAGGAGGAIIQGIMSWCPLDMLQDENFYANGAEITRVTTAGDELCIIYDRGIGFYSGEVNVGIPQCRAFVAAREVGSFNPTNVWQAKDGSVWFEGAGRLYAIKNGQVVEASQSMGIADFWNRNVENYGDGLRRYQAGYNPGLNMALLVNLPKVGEFREDLGTYAVAVCHDSQSVHPLRFHEWTRFTSIYCLQHDDGEWQFYAGSVRGEIYKVLVKGQKFDRRTVGETITVPVEWTYTTGTLWANGMVYTVGVRFLLETDAKSGIDIEVAVDVKTGNFNSGKFVADRAKTFKHEELDRLEWVSLNKLGGYGIQYRVSGATQRDFKLVSMVAAEELQPSRVMG